MPALNFQKQFADAVEDGDKRQTVRAIRKDGRAHCKVGDTLKLYTGMRTKSCRLLGAAKVTRIRPIKINSTSMEIDGQKLPSAIHSRDQLEQTDNEFAEADGFKSFMDMAEWFDDTHGLPFEGVLIQWAEPVSPNAKDQTMTEKAFQGCVISAKRQNGNPEMDEGVLWAQLEIERLNTLLDSLKKEPGEYEREHSQRVQKALSPQAEKET